MDTTDTQMDTQEEFTPSIIEDYRYCGLSRQLFLGSKGSWYYISSSIHGRERIDEAYNDLELKYKKILHQDVFNDKLPLPKIVAQRPNPYEKDSNPKDPNPKDPIPKDPINNHDNVQSMITFQTQNTTKPTNGQEENNNQDLIQNKNKLSSKITIKQNTLKELEELEETKQ